MSDAPVGSAWSRALAELAAAGDRLAAHLRERGDADAEVDASLAVLGALMFHYLNQICADPDHPRFVPGPGYLTRIGTPNPDTTYQYAAVDGSGTYLLTGERGTTPDVSIMPFGPPTAKGQQTFPPFDLAELAVDGDGRFDVVVSPTRPAGRTGDWWQLDPSVRSLMLRCTSHEWGADRDPNVAIVRLDRSTSPRRSTEAALSQRLATMATTIERMLSYGLGKADELRRAGENRLELVDYAARGAMPGQWYHEGAYRIAPADALVVEVGGLHPATRFSVSLTDPLLCTLDWTYAQSSLNHRQAALDADGVLRLVLAHDDPGIANWLDTTGHSSGVVQCRWAGQDDPPELTTRVVTLGSLRDAPPAGAATLTPPERAEAARRRAIDAQLRTLW